MRRRSGPLLSELELDVLAALSRLGGRCPASSLNPAIRSMFGRSASLGRIYVALGQLSERGLLTVRSDVVWMGNRNRRQSFAALTKLGEVLVDEDGLGE